LLLKIKEPFDLIEIVSQKGWESSLPNLWN